MGSSKLFRILTGGLWLKFNTNEWVRCSWAKDQLIQGYIMHPRDDGMFHITFNGIIKKEDYSYGHNNEKKNRLLRLLWKRN